MSLGSYIFCAYLKCSTKHYICSTERGRTERPDIPSITALTDRWSGPSLPPCAFFSLLLATENQWQKNLGSLKAGSYLTCLAMGWIPKAIKEH